MSGVSFCLCSSQGSVRVALVLSAFDIHQNKMYCFGYFMVAYQATPKLKWLKIITDYQLIRMFCFCSCVVRWVRLRLEDPRWRHSHVQCLSFNGQNVQAGQAFISLSSWPPARKLDLSTQTQTQAASLMLHCLGQKKSPGQPRFKESIHQSPLLGGRRGRELWVCLTYYIYLHHVPFYSQFMTQEVSNW